VELRQLQYFLAICKYRNISHAAKAIHISQQALSKQIHDLEEELGVCLFIRNVNGVEPTRYAQCLESPAKQLLAKRNEMVQMIEDMKKEEIIHLRIGFIHGGFTPYGVLSSKDVFDLEQQFHHLEIDIFERTPGILEEMLDQEELDLAVTIDDAPNPKLVKKLVSTEPAYLLFSSRNKELNKQELSVEDLRNQKFLISQFDSLPLQAMEQIEHYLGFKPDYKIYHGGFEQGVERVRLNEGIMVAGKNYFLSRNMKELVAKPFPDPTFVFQHYLAYKEGRKLSEPLLCILHRYK
jgi:DNA-binding transcriptional LysR family regulator